MKVEDEVMTKVCGGETGVGTTFLSYLSTAFKTIYGIGQGFGGAIRRIATNNVCPF